MDISIEAPWECPFRYVIANSSGSLSTPGVTEFCGILVEDDKSLYGECVRLDHEDCPVGQGPVIVSRAKP